MITTKTIVTQNDIPNIIKQLDENTTKLVGAVTAAVEEEAKQNLDEMIYRTPPAPSGYVRTGNLIAGVNHTVKGRTGEVLSNAEYSIYVHEGTQHNPAKPYLFNAVRTVMDKVGFIAKTIGVGK